jgi:hypothetical protein
VPTPSRPVTLLAAAGLVALQALVVLGLGCYLAVSGITGHPSSVATAEIAGALIIVTGAGLLLVAWGIAGVRRWSRSPAALTQALSLPVAWGLVQGGRPEIGLPVGGVALLALVLLFLPASSVALDA